MTDRRGTDTDGPGPYRGPEDAAVRARWRAARREVVRREHPDRGGDAATMQRRLEELDRRFAGLEPPAPGAPVTGSPVAGAPVRGRTRVRRGVRRLRRLARSGRARIPEGWPGRRRYGQL